MTDRAVGTAPLAITMGDASGVGPEIVLRHHLDHGLGDAVVFGDLAILRHGVPGPRPPGVPPALPRVRPRAYPGRHGKAVEEGLSHPSRKEAVRENVVKSGHQTPMRSMH